METEVVETPAVVDDSASLADHEQAFGRDRAPVVERPERVDDGVSDDEPQTARDRADNGQFTKQRAKSQRAGAEDVEKINAYTKRIREAEESLGLKIEKQPGESDRVYNLRRRAELLEAKREAARTAPPVVERPAPKAPEPFKEAEPRYEDFANEPDQYAAFLRATAAYDRRKDAAEGALKQHETQTHEAIAERNRQRDAWFKAKESEHLGRMEAYHQSHPEAQAILDRAGDIQLTAAVYSAIMTADNSPDLLMRIAQDEDLRDDLTILTDGKPVTKDLVALVQRRLTRGLTAGTTGAASLPTQTVKAVPRPPTPVRTGPMKTSETPPSDEGSLADHERYYGRTR